MATAAHHLTDATTLMETLVEAMARLTDSERLSLLESILDSYCATCGTKQEPFGRSCRCENDE